MIEEERIFENLSNLHFCYICEDCSIVDFDMNRSYVGYECPRCGEWGAGSIGYFPINVFSVLDLIQEYYRLEKKEINTNFGSAENNKNVHFLSIIIFFCTLTEVLLTNFFISYFEKTNVPKNIQTRLLTDNLLVRQRIDKLFPSLIGVKWNTAINKISKNSSSNYKETLKFYRTVVEVRNRFLHRGNVWLMPDDMPINCLRQISPLINLFIDLHNKYIASLPFK